VPISGAGLPARVIRSLTGRWQGTRNRPRTIGGDMDKPADGRGSTGSTDGIKAKDRQ